MVLPIIAAVAGGAISALGARSAARTQGRAANDAARMQIEASERASAEQRAAADRAFGIQSGLTREGIAAQNRGMNEANRFVRGGVSASNRQLEGFRGQDVARFDPFTSSGVGAQNALAFNLGVGDRPDGYQGFAGSPGYDFRFGQGMDAVQGSVAARQGLNSGAAMQELNRFGQGIASNEWNNYIAQLSGLAGSGQNAANSQANISMGYGGQIAGNTMQGGMQQGQNRMQGGVNTGNALGNLGSQLGNLTTNTGNAVAGNTMAAGRAGAEGVASAGNVRAAGTVGMANAFNNFGEQMAGNWQFNQMNNAFSRDRNPGFTPAPRPGMNTSQFWTGNY